MQGGTKNLTFGSYEFAYLDEKSDSELTAAQAVSQLYMPVKEQYTTVFVPPDICYSEISGMDAKSYKQTDEEGKSTVRSILKTELIKLTERNLSAWIDAMERLCIIHEVEWMEEDKAAEIRE